jgi:DNA-directed RNA polymerase specialized sigma24 family protein
MSLEEALSTPKQNPSKYGKPLEQLAKEANMSPTTLRKRLAKMSLEEALSTPVTHTRTETVTPRQFDKPLTELAREAGQKVGTVRRRLRRGMSLEEALAPSSSSRRTPRSKRLP